MIDSGASTTTTSASYHSPPYQQQRHDNNNDVVDVDDDSGGDYHQTPQRPRRSHHHPSTTIASCTTTFTTTRTDIESPNPNHQYYHYHNQDPLTEPLLSPQQQQRPFDDHSTPLRRGGGSAPNEDYSNHYSFVVVGSSSSMRSSSLSKNNPHRDREVLCCSGDHSGNNNNINDIDERFEDEVHSSLDGGSRRGVDVDDDDDDDDYPTHHHRHHVPWYKNPYQRMAMISNFGTSYNVVNISLVLPILEELLKTNHDGNNSSSSDDATTTVLTSTIQKSSNAVIQEYTPIVASSLLAGMIVGQLVGGALGDVAWIGGLSGALRIVMILQIVASLGSASVSLFTTSSSSSSSSFPWGQLVVWRFILGMGAGAVYPLAACLSVEQAGSRSSGGNHVKSALKRVVRTFAVQGVGFWMVPALTWPLLGISALPLQHTWRIVLALGALPGLVLLVSQLQLYRTLQQPTQLPQTETEEQVDFDEPEEEGEERGGENQQSPSIKQQLHGAENDGIRRTVSVEGLDYGGMRRSDMTATTSTSSSSLRFLPNRLCRPGNASFFSSHRRVAENEEEEPGGEENDGIIMAEEDSDGEIGTYLDSAPDLSSGDGCYGPSEPPGIHHGWWAAIVTEENLCRKFLGTGVTWFLFDVLFYGNSLFQAIVVEATFGANNKKAASFCRHSQQQEGTVWDPRKELQRTALDSLILASIALPGYIVAGLLIGREVWGITQSVRFVMLQGFGCMSLLYLIIGWYWSDLRRYSPLSLVILYGMTFFFANYGPNTTTFVLPALVYSPECRSTLNGFSAAAGKLGALCGAMVFAPAAREWGDATVMLLCAAIGAVAFVMTACFVQIPPTLKISEAAEEEENRITTPPSLTVEQPPAEESSKNNNDTPPTPTTNLD